MPRGRRRRSIRCALRMPTFSSKRRLRQVRYRSEEHTSELHSPDHLVCRLLLEKKKKKLADPKSNMKEFLPCRTNRGKAIIDALSLSPRSAHRLRSSLTLVLQVPLWNILHYV